MRVAVSSLDDFLANLTSASKLHLDTIYVDIVRRPKNGTDREQATKFEVTFQASAIVIPSEESSHLVQYGEKTGCDYEDSQGERTGSDLAAKLKAAVIEYAGGRNLRVLPGVLG